MNAVLTTAAAIVLATSPEQQKLIEEYMQATTDAVSLAYGNYALQASFMNRDTSISVAAGYDDLYPPKLFPHPSQVGDGFLVGSLTKMITGASVMQLVEAGKVGLDDPIAPLIDPYIYARNKTTLLQLWNGDQRINEVTIRQCLGMTSGIPDFDTYALRVAQEDLVPHTDITPYDILRFTSKTFTIDPLNPPVGIGNYSSTNYELLGFLLAAQANASDWDTLDQGSVFPVREGAYYDNATFARHGTLSSYETSDWSIAHGYPEHKLKEDLVWNVSATSGWACGNFLTSTRAMTQFTYDLFGPEKRIVGEEYVNLMITDKKTLDNLDNDTYGLSLMYLTRPDNKFGFVVGHVGQTYGFSSFSGYNLNASYALTVVTNAEASPSAHLLFHTLITGLSTLLKAMTPASA